MRQGHQETKNKEETKGAKEPETNNHRNQNKDTREQGTKMRGDRPILQEMVI